MKCKYPSVLTGGMAVPCGKCLPCLIRRRRVWATRLMMEAREHQFSAFVTLTYADDAQTSLELEHVQLWLKRLRFEIEPQKLRYYVVGEYGDKTQRPHYHAILFGYRTCLRGRSMYGWLRSETCCTQCDRIRRTWGFGNVELGEVTHASCSYTASYVTKKLTHAQDPRLQGRAPEFARMSLRPGIGATLGDKIADIYRLYHCTGDIQPAVRVSGRLHPIGRYISQRAYKALGRVSEGEGFQRMQDELRPLYEHAKATAPPGLVYETFRQAVIDACAPQAVSEEWRYNNLGKTKI